MTSIHAFFGSPQVGTFLLALVLGLSTTRLLIRLAPRLGMIDRPHGRKSHASPVPTSGGLAIALAALLSILLVAPVQDTLRGFVPAAAMLAIFGSLDDRHPLPSGLKLLGQFAAAAFALLGSGDDALPTAPAAALVPLAKLLFLVATMNAVNLMDGLDGLAAGCCLLTLLGILSIHLVLGGGLASVPMLLSAMLGGLLAFLRYNLFPARLFMGDAGSLFLGLSLGMLLLGLLDAPLPLTPPRLLLLLGLPALDMLAVAQHRLRRGRSPFAADRNHIHHRLLDMGLSHAATVRAIVLAHGLVVAAALWPVPDHLALLILAAAALLLALRLLARRRVRREEGPA